MDHYAQTHLQLYRQLQDAEYGEADLLLVDRAYQIAMRLFSGHYRPNNKPFLIHLIGVASILANARQPAFVVAAGLLHSAYSLGLGYKDTHVKPRFRKEITEALGDDAEKLIYDYSSRIWSVQDFGSLAADLPSSAIEEQQLYLIKMADVHEEFLDNGQLFQPRKKLLWDTESNTSWLEDIANLIDRLGYESWARDFQRDVNIDEKKLPVAILGKASSSFILAPGLSNSSLKNRLVRWLSRH